VVTISLWLTGRLALYINPDGAWFAVAMAVITLVATIASFALPLGGEADHGHDHGEAVVTPTVRRATVDPVRTPAPEPAHRPAVTAPDIDTMLAQGLSRREIRERLAASAPVATVTGPAASGVRLPSEEHRAVEDVAEVRVPADDDGHGHPRRTRLGLLAAVSGGIAASAVAVAALVLPPATLSVELAMSRDLGVAPLFAGADVVQLASGGDVTTFGIGEWATVFQTAPNLDVYDGADVELVGFVVPGDDGAMRLSRLVVTHCVIDAQPAGLPVASPAADFDTGQWVRVDGTVRAGDDGALTIEPSEITAIDEPADPYEY